MTRAQRLFMRQYGNALNVERVSLGMTQAELAAAVHVEDSTISRWENGERMISLYDSTRLQGVLNTAKVRLAKELVDTGDVILCR